MTDDPIERYLSRRAADLPVGGAGVAAVAARARGRRHRRSATIAAVAVGVLVAGGVTAAELGGDRTESIRANGATVAPSALTWTTVEVADGLGGLFESGEVASASGRYKVSTGPASQDPEASGTRLYRTTDGVSWASVALPGGVQPASLAADAERVYAVGTAPAGGGVTTRLLTSTDGATWATEDLPLGSVAFPGVVRVVAPTVARVGATTVVAMTVYGELDRAAIPGVGADDTWDVTPDGVVVYDPCKAQEEKGPEATTMPASTTLDDGVGADPAAGTEAPGTTVTPEGEPTGSCDPAAVVARHSWAELGLTAEQGRLADGETVLFTVDGDGPPVEVGRVVADSFRPLLVAGDSGVWLIRERYDGASGRARLVATRSPDGRDWSAAPIELGAGFARAVGLLGSTPTIASPDDDGTIVLVGLDPTGPRRTDLGSLLPDAAAGRTPAAIAFGGLGVAVAYSDGAGRPGVVATSTDGTTFSVVDLPAAPAGTDEHVAGVSVSADAVTVRLNRYPVGTIPDERAVPVQRAFVGTPG